MRFGFDKTKKYLLKLDQQGSDGKLGVWLNNSQSYMGRVKHWRILADCLSGQTSGGLKSGSTEP
jgi:hypothetical protein